MCIKLEIEYGYTTTHGQPIIKIVKFLCTCLNLYVHAGVCTNILHKKELGNFLLTWKRCQYLCFPLTLTLPMWRIWWDPNNASRWQMEPILSVGEQPMYRNYASLCSLCDWKESSKAIYILLVFMNNGN